MNYSELPLKERIGMASEYALFLIEDSVLEEDVLKELQETFFLSEEQALDAVQETKNKNSYEYRRLQNTSIYKTITSIAIATICGCFYLAMGEEIGVVFMIIGILFLSLGVFSLVFLVQKLLDKFFYSPTLIKKRIERSKTPKKERLDWTLQLFALSFFFLIISFFNYFKKWGWVDLTELVTVSGLQLKQPLRKESTGGKSPTYYYVFYFRKYPNEFHFRDEYYSYASDKFNTGYLELNDTISIQVKTSDYNEKLRFHEGQEEVDIINVIKEGQPLIDLKKRNQEKLEQNRLFFIYLSIACAIVFLIMVIRHKIAADRDRRSALNIYYSA